MLYILQSAACLHTHKHTSMHNEKWLSRGCVWPVSILAWRVLARSEYASFAKVIHLYKIYIYFDLGADRQISLRGATEKLGRKKTTHPLPLHPIPAPSIHKFLTMQEEGHQLFTPPDKASDRGRREEERERFSITRGQFVSLYHLILHFLKQQHSLTYETRC